MVFYVLLVFTAIITFWLTNTITSYQYPNDEQLSNKREQWPFVKTRYPFPVQSPVYVPIERARPLMLEPIVFTIPMGCENEDIIVENTGVYAEVKLKSDIEERPFVSGGPLIPCTYIMEQMHFHWSQDDFAGSENHLKGHREATELHLVMYCDKYENFAQAAKEVDGVAVFAFFGHLSEEDNPDLADLVNKLGKVIQPESETSAKFGVEFKFVEKLIREKTYYLAFPGSLTTPPYNECVTWILYPHAFPISHNQLQAFRQLRSKDGKGLIRVNDRPLQHFHKDRPIIVSVDRYV